ncbi:MAG: hypothetical protein R3A44_05405 [Caldilineaceae bacterium]
MKLIFLHTSSVHIETFDRLLRQSGAAVQTEHLVHEDLLEQARQTGITVALQDRVSAVIENAAGAGDFVLCTCSTIGGCAEALNNAGERRVVRVDRAMARRAVELGEHILVCAALHSTLAPTQALIAEEAQAIRKTVQQTPLICETAWTLFEMGDLDGYHRRIADDLRRYLTAGNYPDVIVLAQASMAGAAAYCTDLSIPILSSPQLGINAALKTLGMMDDG